LPSIFTRNSPGDNLVALEMAFRELVERVQALRDGLFQLNVTFDDKPPEKKCKQEEPILVGQLGDILVGLLALGDEAVEAAREGSRAVEYPTDLERAHRALVGCRQQLRKLEAGFETDPLSRKRIEDLRKFARQCRG